MELLNQFIQNWKKKDFGSNGKPVLIAVSGGIDSMVMVDLFMKSNLPFAMAHCNFQLRGDDAEGDEQFVKEQAFKLNVPFFSTRFDTKEKSEEWKKGIQETARILRYEWLDEIRKLNGFGFIATAHHANDNAETLLMNLFKGTGISGLHGIPERNENVIRPLLFALRKEIQQYATDHEISFREDISNASDKYLRNAVRLNIIPAIENYFPNVIEQLSENIHRFSQSEILYKKEVDRQLKKLAEQRGNDVYIPVLKLKRTAAKEPLCYELFRQYGFSAAQIPHVIQLADSSSGHYLESTSHRVIKDRDLLIITAQPSMDTDFILIEGAPCVINAGKHHFHFSFSKKPASIPESSNLAYIDAHKISFPLILRRWRQGDYFYPLGMGMKKKKIARFLIDQKIPLHEKENIWVLEADKRIVWVAGRRLDERFRVKESSQRVLKVEMK